MDQVEVRRPGVVSAAVAILGVLLVVGFFRSMARMDAVSLQISPAVVVGMLLVSTGLAAVLLGLIADGRNWARVVYLVLVLYGVLMLFRIGAVVPQAAVDVALGIAVNIAQLVAMVLLYTPASNAWFRHRRAVRAAAVG